MKPQHKDDIVRVAISMLGGVQEMLELGLERETIRRKLNRVKYYLDKSCG